MARIRSIHPGLASDEAFMSMSFPAQAGWPLLWTECDDHGIFEWKPLVLKARIFPAASIDFAELLTEWERLGCIQKVEIGGKPYGLVRNFCRFQKPKNPSYRYDLPEEYRNYVGLNPSNSGGLPQPSPSPTENPSLMEEGIGGGNRRREEDAPNGASKYFFETGVIRLSKKDFDKWSDAFVNLNLKAELIGLTEWAGKQNDWFFAVSGALAKRNREIANQRASPPRAMSSREKLYREGIV